MTTKFIHTADWQIGKPFHGVEDTDKRSVLRNVRIDAIKRFKNIIDKHTIEFILVAGDLFDSPTPTKSIISSMLSAIGELRIPVYAISGNHDYAGVGSIWEQDFFIREKSSLAPNLHVLLNNEPIELKNAILFPCPLLRRHEPNDLTVWLRNFDFSNLPSDKSRIVLAHGSVQSFQGSKDDDESEELTGTNFIDLDKLPIDEIDYIALGDWHGTKEINSKAWYSGTHEPDRFGKGQDYDPGNVLLVETTRAAKKPNVERLNTSQIKWVELDKHISDESLLENLEQEIFEIFQNETNQGLLKLNLTGYLGLHAHNKLQKLIEILSSRLIRLKLVNEVKISPSQDELNSLIENNDNPLISAVANNLFQKIQSNTDDSEIAGIALRQLYLSIPNQ